MKNVSGRLISPMGKANGMFPVALITKLVSLIEKCAVYASRILAVRHAVAIGLFFEWRMMKQPMEDRVIFHFA